MIARVSRIAAGATAAGAASALTAAALGFDGEVALALARVDSSLRPILASVLPADAFIAIYSGSRSPVIGMLSNQDSAARLAEARASDDAASATKPHLAMGLSFRNDLGNAAGLDKDGSLLDFNYALGAGFTVVGTVLSEPHTGNLFDFLGGLWRGNAWTPLPQSGAALNSLGLPSKGVDCALDNIATFRLRHGIAPQKAIDPTNSAASKTSERHGGESGGVPFPIGVSIMGHPAHDGAGDAGARKLRGVLYCVERALPLSDFIEINESCPNVHHGGGGGAAAANADLASRLKAVVAVRDKAAREMPSRRRVPILVKLGDVGDAKQTVRLLSSLGVDGLVLLNTQKDYHAFDLPPADRSLLRHYTQRYGGGLSGPPVRGRSTAQAAAAMRAVRELRLDGSFTVIHVGGIEGNDDVRESRDTGAELRQWYTGLMHGLAQPEVHRLYARVTARGAQ